MKLLRSITWNSNSVIPSYSKPNLTAVIVAIAIAGSILAGLTSNAQARSVTISPEKALVEYCYYDTLVIILDNRSIGGVNDDMAVVPDNKLCINQMSGEGNLKMGLVR